MNKKIALILLIVPAFISCANDDDGDMPLDSCITENFFSAYDTRQFNMGFTTWSYGPDLADVNDTYTFIANNADIYTEHVDNKIPWNAWMNDLSLPVEFTNEITGKASRKIENKQLLLSVSLLNSDRSELAEDFDGTVPEYVSLNDAGIEDAYFKHIQYLVSQFTPDYLVIAIEVNELRLRAEGKWEGYQLLIQNVTDRIKALYPSLKISESISLHNLYEPDIANPTEYIDEMISHMNELDFVAISFYPFFKSLNTHEDFQEVFDFLHSRVTKPVAFVETGHISENLTVPNLNVSITGDECGQNAYLETLLTNAQQQNYEFVVWWAHRDYDALWNVFPEELKDVGKLWKDTGLLEETGEQKLLFQTWKTVFEKQ